MISLLLLLMMSQLISTRIRSGSCYWWLWSRRRWSIDDDDYSASQYGGLYYLVCWWCVYMLILVCMIDSLADPSHDCLCHRWWLNLFFLRLDLLLYVFDDILTAIKLHQLEQLIVCMISNLRPISLLHVHQLKQYHRRKQWYSIVMMVVHVS